jgi:hypothetical protein
VSAFNDRIDEVISGGKPDKPNSQMLALNGATVPEPSSLVLVAAAVLGLLGYGWRRRRTG